MYPTTCAAAPLYHQSVADEGGYLYRRFKAESREFERERVRYLAANAVQHLMHESGMDLHGLSKKSGRSTFWISRFLCRRFSGSLDFLSDVALALGYQLNVVLRNRSHIDSQEFSESFDYRSAIENFAGNRHKRVKIENFSINVFVDIGLVRAVTISHKQRCGEIVSFSNFQCTNPTATRASDAYEDYSR